MNAGSTIVHFQLVTGYFYMYYLLLCNVRWYLCTMRWHLLSGDLVQCYKWRASDRKVAGSTPSSGDFFTLRQGDSLTLLLGWIAEGYCMEVWARSAEKSAAKRLGRLYESGLV